MKGNLLVFLLMVVTASIMLAISLYIPNSLPAHSDFSALYNTDLALVNRIPIYDLPKVEALAQRHAGIPRENFVLARFPYPPWYALSTFYLGLLSPQPAATLWFELNLAMLFLSLWLLTDGWPARPRLIAFPLALFFLPVLGALSVGQYDFPVLLGTSLLIYALRTENVTFTAIGAVLLTFKPHLGALVLLSVLVYLVRRGGEYGRRGLHSILTAVVLLFLTGFIADPAWPISYPQMLLNYQREANVTGCTECASLPVWLSRLFFDGSLAQATGIAAVLLFILVAGLSLFRSALWRSPGFLLAATLLLTLLVSPYLYNYDFMLLLVPFGVLIHSRSGMTNKIVVVVCFLIPTIAIALWGREANISLTIVTIIITVFLFLRARESSIDVPAYAS